jgi:hypothetical protein
MQLTPFRIKAFLITVKLQIFQAIIKGVKNELGDYLIARRL